jgi:hypothetical protein
MEHSQRGPRIRGYETSVLQEAPVPGTHTRSGSNWINSEHNAIKTYRFSAVII